MNREAGELELIAGEEYRYNGHVYVIAGVSRGFVELHSTTHPSDIRVQTLERLEQAAKRKRFVSGSAESKLHRPHHSRTASC